jgi:hypothetical protein
MGCTPAEDSEDEMQGIDAEARKSGYSSRALAIPNFSDLAEFEKLFPNTPFKDTVTIPIPCKLSYNVCFRCDGGPQVEITASGFGHKGEILIDGKEDGREFSIRGRFEEDDSVRMVKYFGGDNAIYTGVIWGNSIDGGCCGAHHRAFYKIEFNGTRWSGKNGYSLLLDRGSTVACLGQFQHSWAVVSGTQSESQLQLEAYFPSGKQTKITATIYPSRITFPYERRSKTVRTITLKF